MLICHFRALNMSLWLNLFFIFVYIEKGYWHITSRIYYFGSKSIWNNVKLDFLLFDGWIMVYRIRERKFEKFDWFLWEFETFWQIYVKITDIISYRNNHLMEHKHIRYSNNKLFIHIHMCINSQYNVTDEIFITL